MQRNAIGIAEKAGKDCLALRKDVLQANDFNAVRGQTAAAQFHAVRAVSLALSNLGYCFESLVSGPR